MKQRGNFERKNWERFKMLVDLFCHNQSLNFIPWAKGDHGKKKESNMTNDL